MFLASISFVMIFLSLFSSFKYEEDNSNELELELKETPHCKTIEEVCKYLNTQTLDYLSVQVWKY